MNDLDAVEVCNVHNIPLETFVSATEEGTEYFTFCPECEAERDRWFKDLEKNMLGDNDEKKA
jgi:hypothetical protein